MNVHYTLEETEQEDELLLDALNIQNFHIQRPNFKDIVVYK
ncbi:hypothetical protein BMS3Bbin05_00341 [bacterium BMS3Bbin05]|nr:hypothetical protein BMS3Bbin05_00341 [bacterium BMS3Bbin05]